MSVRDRRVLYVQYTNPAAYPPVLNSGRILADAGWNVRMLGAEMDGTETLRAEPHPNVTTRLLPLARVGRRRQVQYARFLALALSEIVRTRPEWVYASDPFSAPVAVAAKRLGLARVVYHEHDAPGAGPTSSFMRSVHSARLQAARTADLLVVPNQTRLDMLVTEARRVGPSVCVWNVPSIREVTPPRPPIHGPVTLYYHGSLNSEVLPLTLLEALTRVSQPLKLSATGYETIGSRGFTERFMLEAHRLGVAERVEVNGPLSRHLLLEGARKAHIGLALMPVEGGNVNMRAMAGASNKAFDYLASGLAILVSDLPEWRQMFEVPGYAVTADPRSAESLATALSRLAASPEQTRRMGEAGRARIASEWTYERQFEPVMAALN